LLYILPGKETIRMSSRKGKPITGCIDPARIPCDKARAYLEKHGLLCQTPEDAQPASKAKKRANRSLWKEWLD